MSNLTETAPAGMAMCATGWSGGTAQFVVGRGFAVNITFPGVPPYRMTASTRRDGQNLCYSHRQNLTSNTYTWFVDISADETLLNITTDATPVFQLGDGVQWIAHEWTPQPNGRFRYYRSANYTVTSEERSIAQQTPQSAGFRVAKGGVVGWLMFALLLSSWTVVLGM